MDQDMNTILFLALRIWLNACPIRGNICEMIHDSSRVQEMQVQIMCDMNI